MKILSEVEEAVINMGAELSDEEVLILVGYGMQHIVHDQEALINYAVNKILREQIAKEQEERAIQDAENKKLKNRLRNKFRNFFKREESTSDKNIALWDDEEDASGKIS